MKPTKELLAIKDRFNELTNGYESPDATLGNMVELCAQAMASLIKFYHIRYKAFFVKNEDIETMLCETEYMIEKIREHARKKEEKIFIGEMFESIKDKIMMENIDESEMQ